MNEHDFEGLVDKYSGRVYNLAYRMTGNRQDAEDITQETFLSVYHNLDAFRGGSSVYSWIYRIALNCALKYNEKIDEAYIEHLEEKIQYFEQKVPAEVRGWYDNPEKAALMNELTKEIRQGCHQIVMQKLSEEQRTVFIMRVILDLSYSEISDVLNISENVIKARLNRARKALLKHFENKCEWFLKGESGVCCKSKIGYSLAQDTEMLKRVYEKAKEYSADSDTGDYDRVSVDYIYKKFPMLHINSGTIKQQVTYNRV